MKLRIGIDYTSAVCQGAGIGRYTRELVRAVLAHDPDGEYRLFAAAAGDRPWRRLPFDWAWLDSPPSGAEDGVSPAQRPGSQAAHSRVRVRLLPIADRHLARAWHGLRLPVPVELFTGRVDVFHSPDFTLPPALGARSLLTIHDLSFITHPDTVNPYVLRYLTAAVPRSLARADHVVAVSEHTRRDLVEYLQVPEERISVVHNGVEPRFRRVVDPERLGAVRQRYDLPERYILHVGTLQPRKNLPLLIEAYAAALRLDPGGEPDGQGEAAPALVLAGGRGWLSEGIFEAIRRCRVEGRVRILGFVDDADLPALYSLAAALAYPSLYEGFGLPVAEAMACGTPVVCSTAAALPEIAGDAALLVPPDDRQGWTSALRRVLADEELRTRLAAAGPPRAGRFTWAEAARRMVEIYNRVGRRQEPRPM